MAQNKKFDIAVIGGGPGGYPAAIKSASSGCSVALIEGGEIGGTCLNRGCIPTKTLLANAATLSKIQMANEFGISVGKVSFDFGHMVNRKDKIVTSIRKNLEGLIHSNQITTFRGYGKFTSPTTIKITGDDNLTITASKTIIATGSEPREMPAFPVDYERIHNSTSILQLQKLPKSLVIIGGGVIGCEFATLYQELGVKITIVEAMDTILPMEASHVAQTLTHAFKKNGKLLSTRIVLSKRLP